MNPVPSSTLITPAHTVEAATAQPLPTDLLDAAPLVEIVELPMPGLQHEPVAGRSLLGAFALVAVALAITALFVGLPLTVAAHSIFHSVAMDVIVAAAILLEAFAVVVFLIARTRGRSTVRDNA